MVGTDGLGVGVVEQVVWYSCISFVLAIMTLRVQGAGRQRMLSWATWKAKSPLSQAQLPLLLSWDTVPVSRWPRDGELLAPTARGPLLWTKGRRR